MESLQGEAVFGNTVNRFAQDQERSRERCRLCGRRQSSYRCGTREANEADVRGRVNVSYGGVSLLLLRLSSPSETKISPEEKSAGRRPGQSFLRYEDVSKASCWPKEDASLLPALNKSKTETLIDILAQLTAQHIKESASLAGPATVQDVFLSARTEKSDGMVVAQLKEGTCDGKGEGGSVVIVTKSCED